FYERHKVDYADYFLAAYAYRHRARLGRADAELSRFATEAGLSATYLALIWSALTDAESATGPLAAVRKAWNALPAAPPEAGNLPYAKRDLAAARPGCERLRDLVVNIRRELKPTVGKLQAPGISPGSQPLVLWRNRQLASRHRTYSGEVAADLAKVVAQA